MTILEGLMNTIYNNQKGNIAEDAKRPPAEAKEMLRASETEILLDLLSSDTPVTVRGVVTDIRRSQIELSLPDGEKMSARTEGTLPLSIGEEAEFVISAKDEKTITLKLVNKDTRQEDPLNVPAEKALISAKIAPTEKNLGIAKELMRHMEPVNEANIKKYIILSNKYPETPLKSLILINAAKIDVTPQNLELFERFNDHDILKELQTAVSNVKEAIAALPEETSREIEASLSPLVKELLTEGPEAAVPPVMPDKPVIADTPASKDNPVATDNPVVRDMPETPENSEAAQLPPPINVSREINDKHDKKGSLMLAPKEISEPDALKDLYKKIKSAVSELNALEQKINAIKGESEKSHTGRNPLTGKVSGTLKFMESVNQLFPFIQIPVRFKEENAHGDLYVYEKKREFRPGDSLSAVLHLSLENLGETDIVIRLTGLNLSVNINAAGEDAKAVFMGELPEFAETMSKKGYTLNYSVDVTDPSDTSEPLLLQFLEAHEPGSTERYSFDMRA